jgi:cysteine desulfurase
MTQEARRIIYLDNAATTQVRPEVLEAMLPYFSGIYGNPSSLYEIGREARKAVETAREQIARAIGAEPSEIAFTGGGTEADNWAVKGVAQSLEKKGRHIVTSAIEHHAVLHTCEALAKRGYEITYVPVDDQGIVDPADVERALRPDTILVSIMMANNEIGTIQPIEEIGRICRARGVLFHTDAVQAAGALAIDMKSLPVDLCSFSAHKIGGAKGVGALYIRKGVRVPSFLDGGAQERRRRAGTENVPGIVGFGRAFELVASELEANSARLTRIRDAAIERVLGGIPHTRLNGHRTKRLPGNANFSFQFIEGESLLLLLDMYGFACSSGSACTSGSLDPSHVLLAIGLPHEIAHGSLRVSFGKNNGPEDVEPLFEALVKVVERLREMSPLYDEYLKTTGKKDT